VVGATFQLAASGFPATYTYTSTGASLPSGLTLSTAGLLSGTPAAGTGGIYNLTFQSGNGTRTGGTQNFMLTVNEARRSRARVARPSGSWSQGPHRYQTGFPAPSLAQTGDALPAGVSFNLSTGVLSGTPPRHHGSLQSDLDRQ